MHLKLTPFVFFLLCSFLVEQNCLILLKTRY